jgi:hypothetical protein
MPTKLNSPSASSISSSQPEQDTHVSYSNYIVGAAIFDLSGLPKEYFTTSESSDMSWVQSIFQALGLQSLLSSSLRLEGFRHAVISGTDYHAIVVRQPARYVALLLQSNEMGRVPDGFLQWATKFDPSILKIHPRFSAV